MWKLERFYIGKMISDFSCIFSRPISLIYNFSDLTEISSNINVHVYTYNIYIFYLDIIISRINELKNFCAMLFTECPVSEDGMERFACPTADRMGRYHCIDDHVLCDGFIDCPTGEDEDRQACMFYKTVSNI